MFSIIICSRTSELSKLVKDNIQKTIGVDYELVVIDNSGNKYSIFSAYNEGVYKSKGEYLVFMHDDILYRTKDWGLSVIKYLLDEQVGAIGLFGGHYLPKNEAYVGDTHIVSGVFEFQGKLQNNDRYLKGTRSIAVAALDGVWFSIRKDLFDYISFDEMFSGFHFYDMDICMQINKLDRKLLVVKDILINHLSGGVINADFLKNQEQFYRKWDKELPLTKGISLSDDIITLVENHCWDLLYQRRLYVENKDLQLQIKNMQNSHAYKVGKIVVNIIRLSYIKKWIKRLL